MVRFESQGTSCFKLTSVASTQCAYNLTHRTLKHQHDDEEHGRTKCGWIKGLNLNAVRTKVFLQLVSFLAKLMFIQDKDCFWANSPTHAWGRGATFRICQISWMLFRLNGGKSLQPRSKISLKKLPKKKPKKRKDGRLIPIVLGSDAAPVTWMHTEESSGGESDGAQIQIWEMALCYGVIAEMAWPATHPSILFVYWFICWKQQQQQQRPASVIIP